MTLTWPGNVADKSWGTKSPMILVKNNSPFNCCFQISQLNLCLVFDRGIALIFLQVLLLPLEFSKCHKTPSLLSVSITSYLASYSTRSGSINFIYALYLSVLILSKGVFRAEKHKDCTLFICPLHSFHMFSECCLSEWLKYNLCQC